MLYEFFYFHDEIELLELKLSEMDLVDRVIIMECEVDFAFKPKPVHYWENRHLFEKYNHKIIHVNCDNIEEQRNDPNPYRIRLANCVKGFKNCEPNDIIMYSDPDVIIKHSSYEKVRAAYYRNADAVYSWSPPVPVGLFNDMGYHFSKLGGVDVILKNLESYPHQELNTPYIADRDKMKFKVENGIGWDNYKDDVVMELILYKPENYPRYVNEHPEIFAKYFKGGMNV